MAVLARLLERTDRDVLVLVRASSRSQADVRLNALLGSVFDAPERHDGRVRAVCGDLTAPGLGLGADREWIAEEVRDIVHGAASVAFDMPLAESRSINVEGTRRVLDLGGGVRFQRRGSAAHHIRVDRVCGGGPARLGTGGRARRRTGVPQRV